MEEIILIVEDELEIAELVRDYLIREGFTPILVKDGEEAIDSFRKEKPSLVVLDIMLPKINGIEVCRILRAESSVPIIMMTAKQSDTDKIIALGIGADDYVTKPFSPGELMARVKAQLRRYRYLSLDSEEGKEILRLGSLEIDPRAYQVRINGKVVDFSAKEFQLLQFLVSHAGQVFSKEQLFNQVWGYDSYGDLNTVTVYISKVREKIEVDPAHPKIIKTVWGVGYKIDKVETS